MRFGLPSKRTRQPSQLAQIDWSNPLTQGLVFASSMGMPQDATFATATTHVNAGVKFGAGTGGVGISPTANNTALDFASRDASNVTGGITCLAFGIQATTGADASAIAKCATNGGTNTPFDFGTVNGGQLRFGRANSAYRVWKGVASVGNTASRVSAVSQGVDIAVAPKFYIDGVFDTGTATSIYSGAGVGAATSNATAVRALNRGDVTTPYQGTLYLALVWNRELSPAEHAALGANPWQVFKSPQRRLLTIVVVGGASNTAINPGAGSVTLTGYAPSITRTAHQSVAPGAGSLAIAGYAPVVTQSNNQAVAPAVKSIAITGYAPSITQSAAGSISPTTGVITVTGYAPTVTRTAHQTVSPAAGALTITGYAPTITQGLPAVTPNEYSATIMRESIINSQVTALLDRISSQAGTMVDTLNSTTIMRATEVNSVGNMRANDINQTANIL